MDLRPTLFSESGEVFLTRGAKSKSGGFGSEHELISLRKGPIMSRRTLVSLAATVVVGVTCLATVSTDAFAYRRGAAVGRTGVYHGGAYRAGVYRGAAVRRGVAVGVGAAAVGVAAAGAYGAYGAYSDPGRPYYGYGYNGWTDYFRGQDGMQHICQ